MGSSHKPYSFMNESMLARLHISHEAFMAILRDANKRVLDHWIVGKEGYCSFVESRLMPIFQ
jgi:DNA repair protein RadC